MKYLLGLFAALLIMALQPSHAAGTFVGDVTPTTTAQVIGHGCTTAFFIDTDCDGCGIGVFQSGTFTAVTTPTAGSIPTGYQAVQSPPGQGSAPFYAVSDSIDADDTDPSVCTTADWQAKWGSNEAGMENFLSTKKAFTNVGTSGSRVFYLSLTGSNASGAAGDPTHPYFSFAPILTVIKDLQGGAVIVRGATLNGTGTVAVNDVSATCNATPSATGCTLSSAWTGPTANGSITTGQRLSATLSTAQVMTQVSVTNGSTTVSWPSQTVTGSPTTSITIHYATLTVGSAPSPTNLGVGQKLTMTGLPPGSFIQQDGTGTGGAGTYFLGNSSQSFTAIASTTAFAASWGVSLNFNPCYDGNSCAVMSGSSGHPLYVMNYPGEVVEDDVPFFVVVGDAPGKGSYGYLTIDGLKFWAPMYGQGGDFMQFYYGHQFTVLNSEFVGGFHIEVSFSSDVAFRHNVFHDMFDHSIYFSFGSGSCITAFNNESPAGGDFNFAQDATNVANNYASCGATYRGRILDNVVYSSGTTGYDSIHANQFADDTVISGNIISYTGGVPISLEQGNYNARISGNLVFDNASSCYQNYIYGIGGSTTTAGAANHNDLVNNVCWAGLFSDSIQHKNPGQGLQIVVCTISGCGTTVTKTTYIKNSYVVGNVFDTSDTNVDLGQVAMDLESYSYPDTITFNNNIIFSNGTLSGGRTVVAANSPTVTAGTYTCGGTAPTCTWTTLNSNWSGNQYKNPGFVTASESQLTTPGQFNFGLYNLH